MKFTPIPPPTGVITDEKKIVRIDIQDAVRRAGRFIETAQPAVDENNKLRWAGRAHGIRRECPLGVYRSGNTVPLQADRLGKIWLRDTAWCEGRTLLRCAWSNLRIESRCRILWTVRAPGNYKFVLDKAVLPRPFRRVRRHDVGGSATNAFLTGFRVPNRVTAATARRLTESNDSENDGCGDKRRDKKPPREHSVWEGHRLQGEFQNSLIKG